MKIAYVTYSDFPESAAVAHRIHMIAKGLVYLGHEVHILAPYRSTPGPLAEDVEGVQVHWAAHGPTGRLNKFFSKIAKRLSLVNLTLKAMRAGLDWLILYEMGPDALPFLGLAKITNCSIAAETVDLRSCRNSLSLRDPLDVARYKLGEYLVAPHVQLNIIISKFLETHLAKIAPKVPRVIVSAPVDVRKYRYDSQQAEIFRKKFGLEKSLVLMYSGSHFGIKGASVLIQAFKNLAAENNQLKLIITGDLDHCQGDQNLKQIVGKLNLEGKLILTGYLPESEIVPAMSAADILIEPKTDHVANMAAFPQKLAEYLSVGKPIVASAIGDIPQYLHSGENALLCRPGDPQSLAETIRTLMKNPSLRQELSKKARETAMKYFDNKKIAQRLEHALLDFEDRKHYNF
jgi:glycosyltransferase involved in cell wall biosynthesis